MRIIEDKQSSLLIVNFSSNLRNIEEKKEKDQESELKKTNEIIQIND